MEKTATTILEEVIKRDQEKLLLAASVETKRHNGIIYEMVRYELAEEAMEEYASQFRTEGASAPKTQKP